MDNMTIILETLRPIGMTMRYKGFKLLVYAISLAMSEEYRRETTQAIFMETASRFNCTPSSVERNIRTVISHAWEVDPVYLSQVMGAPLKKAPSVSKFIKRVVLYIRHTQQAEKERIYIMEEKRSKLTMTMAELGMSTRICNALGKANIKTVADVLKLDDLGFIAIRDFGEKGQAAVIAKLEELGFDCEHLKWGGKIDTDTLRGAVYH